MIALWIGLMLVGGWIASCATYFLVLFSSRKNAGDAVVDALASAVLVGWAWFVIVFWISPMEVTW